MSTLGLVWCVVAEVYIAMGDKREVETIFAAHAILES